MLTMSPPFPQLSKKLSGQRARSTSRYFPPCECGSVSESPSAATAYFRRTPAGGAPADAALGPARVGAGGGDSPPVLAIALTDTGTAVATGDADALPGRDLSARGAPRHPAPQMIGAAQQAIAAHRIG